MTYQSPYGKAEGLSERIGEWIERLSTDPALPWVGLGLIDDLKAVQERLLLVDFHEQHQLMEMSQNPEQVWDL